MSFHNLIPSSIKSIALSAIGWRKSFKKYGSDFAKHFNYLVSTAPKQQLADSNEYLDNFLQNISRPNSIYQPETPGNGITFYPVNDKKYLKKNYDRLTKVKPYMVVKSSGTSGVPLAVPYDRSTYQKEYAFWWFHRHLAGINKGDRVATIMGHKVVTASRSKSPFWLMNHYENQLIFSSYHLSNDNMKYYIAKLNEFKPDLIHAYPSSIYLISKYILENNINLEFIPRMIQTASETTLAFQRDVIEKAFKSRVYIWYGNTEYAGHITEYPDGKLRVQPWHSYIRILDSHGQDVQPGEEGHIVATNFTNTCFPLINYDTKDIAQFGGYDENGMMLIDHIVGRLEDYIITKDGRYVGRLDHIFKNVKHVRNAQLIQNEIGKLIIRIEKEDSYASSNEKIILRESKNRLGKEINITFEYINNIPKNKNGKFSFIIQNLSFAKMNNNEVLI